MTRQVSIKETNASEPLNTRREFNEGVETEAVCEPRRKKKAEK